MNLKNFRRFAKEQIVFAVIATGIVALGIYITYEVEKDRLKRWYKTFKETRDDSRTDLSGE